MRRALTLAALCVSLPALAAGIGGYALVVDGDTIEIRGREVGLYGIDAPEIAQPCERTRGVYWPCGREAAAALAELIGGRWVYCDDRGTSRQGRAVAVCTADGTDLGAAMVAMGHALADRRQALDYVDEEEGAREARAGMWRGAFVPPWEWRRGRRPLRPR